MLGVSLSTIQLWTENGLLNAWRTGGGHRRIPRSAVEGLRASQREAGKSGAGGSRGTLVVVEDKPEIRKLYERQFRARHLPLEVVSAGNGFEGLIQIGRHKPDVIITDLLMPGMDGFEMLDALNASPELKDTLIVVVSALTREEVAARGGFTRAVVFFQKPVDFDALETLVLEKLSGAGSAAGSIQTENG